MLLEKGSHNKGAVMVNHTYYTLMNRTKSKEEPSSNKLSMYNYWTVAENIYCASSLDSQSSPS